MALTVLGSRGTWDPAQTVSVFTNAGTWVSAQTVKALNASGEWIIVWPPLAPHFHEVVPSGGYTQIQAAMDRARAWFEGNLTVPVDFDNESTMACVELVSGVTYDIGAEELRYRRGVRLIGNGATITGHGTHIFKGDDNGGGQYNARNRDWQIIDTKFDCESAAGGMSTAHVYRFRLDGVEILNIQGGKHHLEINSSGGPKHATEYNVQILNSEFFQTIKHVDVRTEDEAIQLDYSWDGAAPDVANDGTVTNNVLVLGCKFHEVPRAVGAHSYNSQPTLANGIHSHILIEGNTFRNVNPVEWGDGNPNSASSEGAVRSYYWSGVIIQDNTFDNCYQPVMVYAPNNADGAAYNMGQTSILRNIFENCGSSNQHIAYGSSGGSKKIGTILFEDNIVQGTFDCGPDGYVAGFDDTAGTLPNSTHSVVIRGNTFMPTNYDVAAEAGYNKYRAGNSTNANPVYIEGNFISDGSIDNS